MLPPRMIEKNVGRCLTQRTIEGYEDLLKTFVRFAYFSQFAPKISWRTTVLPDNIDVRIEAHPQLKAGEIMFGLKEDGSLVWLGEIIDSSD